MDLRKFLGKFTEREDDAHAPEGGSSGEIELPLPPAPSAPSPSGTNSGTSAGKKAGTGVSGLSFQRNSAETQLTGVSASGVVQNDVDDSVYRLRAEQVQRIEAMFGEFGSAVCSFLLTQSLMPGGVRRVAQKLGLSTRGRDGADLAQISAWITSHGAEEFCQKVRIRQRSSTIETPVPAVATPQKAPSDSQNFRPRVQMNSSDTNSRPAHPVQALTIRPVTVNGVASDPSEPPLAPPEPPPMAPPPEPAPARKGFMFAPKARDDSGSSK